MDARTSKVNLKISIKVVVFALVAVGLFSIYVLVNPFRNDENTAHNAITSESVLPMTPSGLPPELGILIRVSGLTDMLVNRDELLVYIAPLGSREDAIRHENEVEAKESLNKVLNENAFESTQPIQGRYLRVRHFENQYKYFYFEQENTNRNPEYVLRAVCASLYEELDPESSCSFAYRVENSFVKFTVTDAEFRKHGVDKLWRAILDQVADRIRVN